MRPRSRSPYSRAGNVGELLHELFDAEDPVLPDELGERGRGVFHVLDAADMGAAIRRSQDESGIPQHPADAEPRCSGRGHRHEVANKSDLQLALHRQVEDQGEQVNASLGG